jgi:uncharacterized membrane protein
VDERDARNDMLNNATLATHLMLVIGVIAVLGLSAIPLPWNLVLSAGAALPLIAMLPGLVAQRRYTQQWLAIVLVIYVTAAVMEVTASGATLLPSVVLLAALIELALLLTLLRTHPRAPRRIGAARERKES